MVRFIHTADIQLGMRATDVPDVAEQIREERFNTLARIMELAKEEAVEFILIAGDLFQDNQVSAPTASRATSILREAQPIPVYLLPGNHDPLTADSVYRRSAFGKQRPDNIMVLDSEESVTVSGGRCMLYPCPTGEHRSTFDPTAGLPARVRRSTRAVSVGVAHGSLAIEGRHSPDDHPIAVDAAARAGVDYLALGHWHSCYRHDEQTAYPGTPEPTAFGERDSGSVSLVSIEKPGARADIKFRQVSQLEWLTWDVDLTPGPTELLEEQRQKIEALPRPEKTLLRVVLRGAVDLDSMDAIDDFEACFRPQGLPYVNVRREVVASEAIVGALGCLAEQDSVLAGVVADLRALAALASGSQGPTLPFATEPLQIDELLALWNAAKGTEKVSCAAAAKDALLAASESDPGGNTMILRRLQVSHVRCFRNPVTLGPFGNGINIFYGPNEAGKSTLMEAAALAIFDRHSTTGREIESFQPWGTSLSPEITLEFEVDGKKYRLQKIFLTRHQALLSEWRGGRYEALHEGDATDKAVRDIMLGELPGRGRAKPSQWGIARLLWSLQGPDGPGAWLIPGVSEPVADRLREALGAVEIRSYLSDILRRVDALYEQVFTEVRGYFKDDSDVSRLRRELEGLAHRQEEASRAVEEVREWADRLEGLKRGLARLDKERCEYRDKIEAYRKEAEAVIETRERIKLAEEEEKAREKDLQIDSRTLNDYRKQRDLYEDSREQWRKLDADYKAKQDEVTGIEQQVERMRADLQKREKQLADLRERLRWAQRVEKAIELSEQRQALTTKAKDLEELEARLSVVDSEIQEAPIPTPSNLRKAEEAEAISRRLKGQMEALGLRLTVRAAIKQTVTFKTEARTQKRKLSPNEEAQFTSGAAATLSLPGVARIDIHSGSTEITAVQEQLKENEATLKELLGHFGVNSAVELATQAAWGASRREMLKDLRADLEKRAAPYQKLGEVRQQANRVSNLLNSLLNELALDSPEALASCEVENTEALTSAIKMEEKEVKLAQGRLENRTKQREDALNDLATLDKEKAVCTRNRDTARERADELLGEVADENDLTVAVEKARARYEKAQHKTNKLREQLPSPEADPEQLMKAASKALDDVERRNRELRDQIAVLQANLEAAETQGRYEKLNALEEEIASKTQQLEREVTRVVGLKILRQVLRTRRRGTASETLQGLEGGVTRILSAVTNRTSRYVRMAPNLSVSGFSSGPEDISTREVRLLSAGTQEQLWMSVRIALGETYAQKYGPQVMVLDDVFVYTDPDRHDRLLQVLRRAAEHLQIFILTSQPSRYRGLAESQYQFDIASLRG